MDSSDDHKKDFFRYVFSFSDECKAEMLNLLQYGLLSMIPLVLLNKGIGRFIPEADDTKHSLELVVEIVLQIVLTLLGLYFVHRMVSFVPTYSGLKHPEMHVVYGILPMLLVISSLQTKLGEKVSVLVERAQDLWEGDANKAAASAKGQQPPAVGGAVMMPSQAPPATMSTAAAAIQQSLQPRQDTTPLMMDGTGMGFEPLAASELLGGSSSFGSMF